MDVEFDCDFRFAGADIAVGAGGVQNTWDQQLLPKVGTLVQEDLEARQIKANLKWLLKLKPSYSLVYSDISMAILVHNKIFHLSFPIFLSVFVGRQLCLNVCFLFQQIYNM